MSIIQTSKYNNNFDIIEFLEKDSNGAIIKQINYDNNGNIIRHYQNEGNWFEAKYNDRNQQIRINQRRNWRDYWVEREYNEYGLEIYRNNEKNEWLKTEYHPPITIMEGGRLSHHTKSISDWRGIIDTYNIFSHSLTHSVPINNKEKALSYYRIYDYSVNSNMIPKTTYYSDGTIEETEIPKPLLYEKLKQYL